MEEGPTVTATTKEKEAIPKRCLTRVGNITRETALMGRNVNSPMPAQFAEKTVMENLHVIRTRIKNDNVV